MSLPLDKEIHRILAVRLDNIGDLVMLGPSLRVMRRNFPAAHITLLATRAGTQVAPLLPWIDEVWEHRPIWQDTQGAMPFDPAREKTFISDLSKRQFDAAFVFTSFTQSPYPPGFACYLAGIPLRIGQSHAFAGAVLSHWIRPLPTETHQVDRNLHLLASVDLAFDPQAEKRLELQIPLDTASRAEKLLEESGIDPQQPFLVVAPGASCPTRIYDPVRLGQAMSHIGQRLMLPMVLVGSRKEEALAAKIFAVSPANLVVSLVNRTTISELSAIIRRCSLLLGCHSGPMHLADAFHRSMVILFSGTDLECQWRPRNSPNLLLRKSTFCSPCYRFNCPYQMECLDIPASTVADQVCSLLVSNQSL